MKVVSSSERMGLKEGWKEVMVRGRSNRVRNVVGGWVGGGRFRG